MKNILALTVITIFLASCGGKNETVEDVIASKDLTEIRKKKDELNAEKEKIANNLKLLDEQISLLDSVKKMPLISTIEAQTILFEHYLELQGNVQTKKNVLVYPEVSGQLLKIYVREGQKVGKGQILAKIDDGGMSNQLAQLQAAEALAKTTFERQKRLWEQKIGSELQFLQAKTEFDSQSNAVRNMQKTLGKYLIRAPFSGVIDDVIKEQGTVVAPGMGSEVFRIVNLSKMYIETDVPENYISTVVKGKDVKVEFPILGKTVDSNIRQAGNFINPANRTYKIEVGVPNKDQSIKPNLTAKLKINDYTNPQAILIPQSIISENFKGQQYVFVVTNLNKGKGVVKQTIIKTGKTQGDNIEVLEGISNGAQIVGEGARSVQNGQEVEIQNAIATK